MRQLREVASSNADARLAIGMFCYSVRKEIAAMIAALGGVDLIVFTGGIGENDAEVRGAIPSGFSWLGVRLDSSAEPIRGKSDQRSDITLCGARSTFSGR